MKMRFLTLLIFLLGFASFRAVHSRPVSSAFLLVQEQGDVSRDFDDSVLKDIEDIEGEEEDDSDNDKEEEDEEDMDEEDLDEEDLDEEDMDEEDMDEEDLDEEDMDEEDMDEEDMDEEDMDEEDMDEEDMDEEDMDEEDMDEEDMDEEDMDEEDMDEEDMDEEDMDEEDMDEEDMDEEDMDEEDVKEPVADPSEPDISLEEEPVEEPVVDPSEPDVSLEEELVEEPIADPSEPDVSLEEEPSVAPSDEEEGPEASVPAEDSQVISADSLNIIGNIRYLAEQDQIIIDSSEVISYQVHHNRKNNQIIIEILQARLSENLKWPYILKDFDTGFGMVQADQKDESTVRILIQVKKGYALPKVALGTNGETMKVSFHGSSRGGGSPLSAGASASGRSLLPPQTLENFYFGNLEFSGHPLSFHVIDAPVKQVLRFISEESGLNMVIDETVRGAITLKLENVPWDQAFLTILQVKNLSYIGQGNVVMISTLDALDQKARKLREMAERSKSFAPFQTKVISVSYANIDEVKAQVKPFLTQPVADGTTTKKGEIISHAESGTLVITDTKSVIERVEKLVSFLDKPPQQVMIEARIVDAVENFSENFGLTWDITGSTPFSINVSGFLEDLKNSWSSAGLSVRERGSVYTLDVSGLPVVGSLSAALNLAETKGYARVVSSPKVVALSGKQASITRNAPILITKAVESDLGGIQRETLEPLDIQISLDVTPHVTPSGGVFMKVQISRSSPGPTGQKKGEAIAITRSAQTEVLVQNGHTVVIGGIYQYDEIGGNSGFPFLRHIPFLKFLFSDTQFSTTKNELLVFLTPKLIDDVKP